MLPSSSCFVADASAVIIFVVAVYVQTFIFVVVGTVVAVVVAVVVADGGYQLWCWRR